MKERISSLLMESADLKKRSAEQLSPLIEEITREIVKRLRRGGKLILFGNGGSAADAQHITTEFQHQFEMAGRKALPAIALSTNTSTLSAIANDWGFDRVFERQIEGIADKNDVVIGITTSGNSVSVIKGLQQAKRQGSYTIAFTGRNGGKIKAVADRSVIVPHDNTARIQEVHITLLHVMCKVVEDELATMRSDGERLLKMIDSFRKKNILVIGDLMLDNYVFGDVKRISPEAPVLILEYKSEKCVPGGAGNVANNIVSFGASSTVIGVVGKDTKSKTLLSELQKRKIGSFFVEEDRPTTQKTRLIGRTQQIIRIDHEVKDDISRKSEDKILDFVTRNLKRFDAVIISDYAKGCVTERVATSVIELANKARVPVIVDPKPLRKSSFKNATLLTPNNNEAHQMLGAIGVEEMPIERVGELLLQDLNANLLITRGEKGMSLFEKGSSAFHLPTEAKEVYDVSGAGDTVVATATLVLASGGTLREASTISNYAAGVVVGKFGTATCTIDELKRGLDLVPFLKDEPAYLRNL